MSIDVESLVHTDDVQEIRLTKMETGLYLVTVIRDSGVRVLRATNSTIDLRHLANDTIESWSIEDWNQ